MGIFSKVSKRPGSDKAESVGDEGRECEDLARAHGTLEPLFTALSHVSSEDKGIGASWEPGVFWIPPLYSFSCA